MVPDLPPEIIALIIENLSDDTSALQACALTCRAWLSPSRAHIHCAAQVELRHNDEDLGYVAFYNNPDLAHHVRELTIGQENAFIDGRAWFRRAQSVMAQLERVLVLNLFRLDWETLQLNETYFFISQFPSVTTLALHDITFGSFEDLLDFVSAFPFLRELRLTDVWWRRRSHSEDVISHSYSISPYLQVLRLGECSAAWKFAEWLCAQADCFQLKTLEVGWAMGEGRDTLDRLIQCVGSGLEHLDVDIFRGLGDDVTASIESQDPETGASLLHSLPPSSRAPISRASPQLNCLLPEVFWNPPSLRRMTRLRKLVFGNLVLGTPALDDTAPSPDLSWVPSILSTISTTYLREMEFCIYLDERWRVAQVPWEQIDDILSDPKFDGLERVTIRISLSVDEPEGDDETVRYIEPRLWRMHSRRILRLERHDRLRSSWRARQVIWTDLDDEDCSDDTVSMGSDLGWEMHPSSTSTSTSTTDAQSGKAISGGPEFDSFPETGSKKMQSLFTDLRELTASPDPTTTLELLDHDPCDGPYDSSREDVMPIWSSMREGGSVKLGAIREQCHTM